MKRKEGIWGLILVAPLTVGIAAFVVLPLLFSLFVAFTDYDLINTPLFTGLDNIRWLVKDPYFLKSLGKTFYNALGVPFSMGIGLAAAVLIVKIRALGGFFKSILFLPAICSSVAVTFMWQFMLDYNNGIINWFLERLGLARIQFLYGDTAMPSMIVMGIWGGMGVIVLLYFAAIKNIPAVYYEAAVIDGANAWRQFRHITLPTLSPITFYILVTQLIGALQDFARFMVMSGNGNSEDFTTAGVYVYQQAFTFGAPGYASAVAWALGLVIIAVTLLNFRVSKNWVSYDN